MNVIFADAFHTPYDWGGTIQGLVPFNMYILPIKVHVLLKHAFY